MTTANISTNALRDDGKPVLQVNNKLNTSGPQEVTKLKQNHYLSYRWKGKKEKITLLESRVSRKKTFHRSNKHSCSYVIKSFDNHRLNWKYLSFTP